MSHAKDKSKSDKNKSPAASTPAGKPERDEELRKIRAEILQFLDEQAALTKTGSSSSSGGLQQEQPQFALSLPKTLHDKTVDVKKQQQVELEKQQQEAKDFFKCGDIVDGHYQVTLKLKDGGFGQVYKVIDNKTYHEMALKVEKNTLTPSGEYLEAIVLKKFQGHPNCPHIYGNGMTPNYVYITMQLLGENLSEIRRSCGFLPARLSESAAYRTTVQCLRATEGLHDLGFLHRDIKPSNFAVGMESKKERDTVYMLDFGLCRYYKNRDGTLKAPRETVGFRGTVRYASITAHEKKELSRKDDLISLFYSFVEFLTGQLPWRKTNDKDKVSYLKKRYSPEVLCQVFPKEVSEFVNNIQSLKYFDKPDYGVLQSCLTRYLPNIPAKIDDPYDWEVSDCSMLKHWRPSK